MSNLFREYTHFIHLLKEVTDGVQCQLDTSDINIFNTNNVLDVNVFIIIFWKFSHFIFVHTGHFHEFVEVLGVIEEIRFFGIKVSLSHQVTGIVFNWVNVLGSLLNVQNVPRSYFQDFSGIRFSGENELDFVLLIFESGGEIVVDLDVFEDEFGESLWDDFHGIFGEEGFSVKGIDVILVLDALD